VVLEKVKFEVQGAILSVCCIGIIPLSRVRWGFHQNKSATYLQILRSAIPDVYGLEKRVIAIVKCATVRVELIGENELLLLAGVRCTRHGGLRRIRINEAVSYVCQ
jgi:hypothetical protein